MKVDDKVLELAKRRGFVWGPSPNIYHGGVSGFYDWGPLGKLLKNKVERVIRNGFSSFSFFEVECPIITPRKVWEASGHLQGFSDPVIKCLKCNNQFRVDNLIKEKYPKESLAGKNFQELKKIIDDKKIKCPNCAGNFSNIETYNLMMKTTIGLDQEAYLRPETATTTYLLFPEYHRFFRTKMPFGVFQIGKAFRNEISPRQGVYRTREFTQAEAQLFMLKENEKDFDKLEEFKEETLPLMKHGSEKIEDIKLSEIITKKYMKKKSYAWMVFVAYNIVREMGFDDSKIRIRQHDPRELAHYAEDAWDIEVETERYGWFELCGVHDRSDYDLKQHSKFSGNEMKVSGEYPSILEIAFGLERSTYSLLENSINSHEERDWLYFKKGMAPLDVGIFPLMKKDNLDKVAKEIFRDLDKEFVCIYDEAGSIGRRYARMDEIGTSFCITVDHDSLKNEDVTIREIVTKKQVRVKIKRLKEIIRDLLYGDLKFEDV